MRVQVRSNVPAVLIGNAHLWHCGVRLDCVRVLDPPGDVFRRIRQLAGNVSAARNSCQRWTDKPFGTVHTGNHMTRVAPILADLVWSERWIAMD